MFTQEVQNFRRKRKYKSTRRPNNMPMMLLYDNQFCFKHTQIIDSDQGCLDLVDMLMKTSKLIAFDCEWSGIYDKNISLLQIADDSGSVYIIDVLAIPNIHKANIKRRIDALLSSNSIIKIIHDCRQDKIRLQEEFGITLRNVFDTQVAYSYLQHERTGKPVKQIPRISLNELYELYGAPSNPMKKGMKWKYKFNPYYWAERPLTNEMKFYAAFDVNWLIQVYKLISKDLDKYNVQFSLGEFRVLECELTHIPTKSKELKVNQSYNFFHIALAFAVLCFAIWFLTLF